MDNIDFAAVAAHMAQGPTRRGRNSAAPAAGGNYPANANGSAFDRAIEDYYGLGNNTQNIGTAMRDANNNFTGKANDFLGIGGGGTEAEAATQRKNAATSFDDAEEPLVFYKGRVELLTPEGGWKEVVPNTGHLGHLDCPGLCGRSGQMGVFSEHP